MHFGALDSIDTIDASTFNISTYVTSISGPNTSVAGTSTSFSDPKTVGIRTSDASITNANTLDTSTSQTNTLSINNPGTSTSKTSTYSTKILGRNAFYTSSPSASTLGINSPGIYASLAQVFSIQASGTIFFEKETFTSVIPAKKTVISNKDVTSNEVPSSTQVFISRFVNEKKDLCIEIDLHIQPPLKTLSLTSSLSDSVVKLATYHPYYKEKREMIESAYYRSFSSHPLSCSHYPLPHLILLSKSSNSFIIS